MSSSKSQGDPSGRNTPSSFLDERSNPGSLSDSKLSFKRRRTNAAESTLASSSSPRLSLPATKTSQVDARSSKGKKPRTILPAPTSQSKRSGYNEAVGYQEPPDPLQLNKPGLLTRVDPGQNPDDPQSSSFVYGPTKLPPESYRGDSPFSVSKRKSNSVPVSAVEFLPELERRVASVERAVHSYAGVRANQALARSSIPGLDDQSSPYGPDDSSPFPDINK